MLRSICAASALAFCGTLGSADTLHFSYELLGSGEVTSGIGITPGTVTGFLEGTETSPGVFELSDAYGLAKDGVPYGEIAVVENGILRPGKPPVISLDASVIDFVACRDADCSEFFGIVNDPDVLITPDGELALFSRRERTGTFTFTNDYILDRPINYAGLSITQSMDYMFEYTTGTTGQVFSGLFEGVVDAGDPNRLFVLSASDLKLDGADIGPAESIVSLGSDIPGVLTFDQSAFDTGFCFDALCSTGFAFNSVSGNFAAGFGSTNILEPFNADGFSFAKAPSAVPLPASGLLLIAGLSAAGFVGRRRRAA